MSKWKMPAELEPYRDLLVNTGGNTAEDLMNRLIEDRYLSSTNSVVFTLACSCESQLDLLQRLRAKGLLKEVPNA